MSDADSVSYRPDPQTGGEKKLLFSLLTESKKSDNTISMKITRNILNNQTWVANSIRVVFAILVVVALTGGHFAFPLAARQVHIKESRA